PGAQQRQDAEHDHHLGREGERLLLDLGGGLEHRDGQAHHQRDHHRRPGADQHQVQRLLGDEDDLVHRYPTIRPLAIMYQPSTITKSRSLNGMEIVVGDSMCMPRANRMLATTMSMTMNGTKRMKPIWKASFSSDTTKAGTMIMKSVSPMLLRSSSVRIFLARLKKSARSLLLTFLLRKERSGSLERLAAAISCPTVSGDINCPVRITSTSPARYISMPVGAMM